jgi:hypothetical protein
MGLPLYNYNNNEGIRTLSVILDGEQYIADDNHPKFEEIFQALIVEGNEDTDWAALFAPGLAIEQEFAKISTELSIRGNKLFYEGEELHDVLADKIVNVYSAGENYEPFVLFMEKLRTNPEQHSIENLYRWLEADPDGFTIADDGDLIVYKYVMNDFRSIHSGPAIRNGVPVNERILNVPGDVIEMDRKDVQHDPDRGCSTGLHVGTWTFVQGQSVIYKVKVNPKYVVSVPKEMSSRKMRVCRYQVIERVESRVDTEYDRGYAQAAVETEEVSFRPETATAEPTVFDQVVNPEGELGWVYKVADESTLPGASSVQHETTHTIRLTSTGVRDTRLNYQTQRRGPDGRFLPREQNPW